MTKLVYVLVAVLCSYLSSNCHAQTADEMKRATAQYEDFIRWFPSIDKSLKADLQSVKKAKRKADFDALTYTEYKKELQDQYGKNVNPIIQLQARYPVVRGQGNQDLEKMGKDVDKKYKDLARLVAQIEAVLQKLSSLLFSLAFVAAAPGIRAAARQQHSNTF
jgi:hypothetical protein